MHNYKLSILQACLLMSEPPMALHEVAVAKAPLLTTFDDKRTKVKLRPFEPEPINYITMPNVQSFMGKTKKKNKGMQVGSYKFKSRKNK